MGSNDLARQAHPVSRTLRPTRLVCALAAGLGALMAAAPACLSAESIAQALSSAYLGNPTLNADRARQRGTDEQVPQALSGWRPTVTTQGRGGYQSTNSNTTFSKGTSSTNPVVGQITLTQPIFSGFRTVAGTKQAEATVEAGKQQLLNTEQRVLARCRDRLHGCHPRSPDRCAARKERLILPGRAQGSQRPLQRGRDHQNRRGPGAGGAELCQGPARGGPRQPRRQYRHL